MPAMHDNVYSEMIKQLERKRDIYLRTLPFEMTHEECIRLIAPREHISILTEAAKFADINASEGWVTVTVPANIDGVDRPQAMLYMRTHDQKAPPLRPRNAYWQYREADAGKKVIDWMLKRYEIGRRFGTVQHVLHMLNKGCENGHQLRYMFPTVLHLCKAGRDPRMDKWMEKFAAYKACKHTPAVSPELKRAIQDSSALLTSAALLGEDVPIPLEAYVAISPASNLQCFKIDGHTVARM